MITRIFFLVWGFTLITVSVAFPLTLYIIGTDSSHYPFAVVCSMAQFVCGVHSLYTYRQLRILHNLTVLIQKHKENHR